MTSNTVLVSCLVLNGSRSGYRRIIRNILVGISTRKYVTFNSTKFVILFQRSGWASLGLSKGDFDSLENAKILIYDDFTSKWSRGLAEQVIVPFAAFKHNANVIFMPATFGLVLPVKPTITFVHTNTSFSVEKKLRGRDGLQQLVHNLLIKITALTSKRLLFTTEQTHKEFQRYCGKQFPMLILGNGLVKDTEIYCIDKYNNKLLKEGYLLSVSQIYRLKNFDSLMKAFIDLKLEDPSCRLKLVIVGTIQESDYYEELLKLRGNRDDILFLHDIDDEYLSALYENCIAYCFFSHFEGYSLTPAEAMLYNKPVSISRIATHVEVYEDSPIYADPNDLVSIKGSIKSAIEISNGGCQQYSDVILNKFSFESFANRLMTWLTL